MGGPVGVFDVGHRCDQSNRPGSSPRPQPGLWTMIVCGDWEPCGVQSCTRAALVLHAPPTRRTRDEVQQVLETWAGVQSGASVGLGTAATRDHCLGKTTEPSVGSELPRAPPAPTAHGACCPWIRKGGRAPPLCRPSFLFGKKLQLEGKFARRSQGTPSTLHLEISKPCKI